MTATKLAAAPESPRDTIRTGNNAHSPPVSLDYLRLAYNYVLSRIFMKRATQSSLA